MALNKSLNGIIRQSYSKTFLAVNFGCRVNAAETNQFSELLIKKGFTPSNNKKESRGVGLVFINTCSVTAKANIESLGQIRSLRQKHPSAFIVVTGCAKIDSLQNLPNTLFLTNRQKLSLLKAHRSSYTPQIGDKFSRTNRFILKIQDGCNHYCTYCVVPYKRKVLWSLPVSKAVKTVKQAIADGYQEIIISGINLNLYRPGLSSLLEALLTQTSIPKISFGSIPLNCFDDKFINLISNYRSRFAGYLHIPLQSGSDKILKLMHRPYTRKNVIDIFNKIKCISPFPQRGTKGDLLLATDIIVGFPGETDSDFQDTYDLCQQIGFSKIHVFRFSPRPGTQAKHLFDQNPTPKSVLKLRSEKIKSLENLL
ncbi:MAG: MiaB/RimO family radical SAM methylthiotransferase [Candidatus Shapirobacteria bacterium]|jgi:threonylcarbamoyladenosine tRNA methylthiotransferase MtaB